LRAELVRTFSDGSARLSPLKDSRAPFCFPWCRLPPALKVFFTVNCADLQMTICLRKEHPVPGSERTLK